jgi:hypothetical protein
VFRSFISILFITCLIGYTQSTYIVLLNFQLNKSYIVSNLCENRYKPELQCNGRCYLKKEMREGENGEKTDSQKSAQKNLSLVVMEAPAKFTLAGLLLSDLTLNPNTCHNKLYNFRNLSSVFRPPRLRDI